MQSNPTFLLNRVVLCRCRVRELRESPKNAVVTLPLRNLLIRLRTRVTSGDIIITILTPSRVGNRQYSDPLLFAGTIIRVLRPPRVVLTICCRLG